MDLPAQRSRILACTNPILQVQAVVGLFHLIEQQDKHKLDLASLRPYLEPCLSHTLKVSFFIFFLFHLIPLMDALHATGTLHLLDKAHLVLC